MPKPKGQPAIRTRGLTKYYGQTRGIEDLDLRVERGEVFGFLGPNGAGKSTTINLLMGFRKPTGGEAKVLGHPIGLNATALRQRIGYMPGELALYERMRAGDLLNFFGKLRGGVDRQYVRELADRFSLDLTKKIADLSKGNKQKVSLVSAWMNKPDLLILDEPTSGLDPLVQQEFHGLVKESTKQGVTVFLSSHVLSEVEHICDRAAIVRDGHLVAIERISGLHERATRHVEVNFAKRPPPNILAGIPDVTHREVEGTILRCHVHGSMDKVVKSLAKQKIRNLIVEHATLEELFFEEYGQEPEETDG